MRIGINSLYQIKQMREITDLSLTVIELDETAYEYPFKGYSDTKILCYCYKADETGLSVYPYIDTNLIEKFDGYAKTVESLAVAGQIATKDLIRTDTLTKEQMLKLVEVYPNYEVGKTYVIGDILTHEGNMFEVVQAHTSQANWIPSTTASLYKNKTPSVVIPNWAQPIGSTDAYKIGDKVIFNTKIYESVINANVWSPTGYPAGWKQI